MRLLIIVNVDWFFISHRLPIAIEALKKGYTVTIACHYTAHKQELIDLGFNVVEIPFSRSGAGIVGELNTLKCIRRTIKNVNPSLIHAVTIKPVLYTGLVLKSVNRNIPFVAAISGLGYVFTAKTLRAKLTRFIASAFYKVALSQKYKRVIFQNTSDENISIVMACRLLREKGVYVYIEAAKLVKANFPYAEFLLVGTPDLENPNMVKQIEIDEWVSDATINYLGHRNDIPSVFANSNIVCLPSFYGEGVPKVLIEAAACGRAIVTTDNPGCKDAIINGVTGISVPVRDAQSLASAIIKLINEPALRLSMGAKGRDFAVQEFDVRAVVTKHLDIYNELLQK
jgi:glycosyltransferase involved in cell wall biosynthesis